MLKLSFNNCDFNNSPTLPGVTPNTNPVKKIWKFILCEKIAPVFFSKNCHLRYKKNQDIGSRMRMIGRYSI